MHSESKVMQIRKTTIENTSELKAHDVAQSHIKNWTPVKKEWATVSGVAFVRSATGAQNGANELALIGQIRTLISEVISRAIDVKVNYKITKFVIADGLSARSSLLFDLIEDHIATGLYSFVAIKDISRLARDVSKLEAIYAKCSKNNCEIIAGGLPFSPVDSSIGFHLKMAEIISQNKAAINSQRVRNDIAAKKLLKK